MLRLCSYYTFACEDCTKLKEPLATHKPFMSVFQPLESPSHAGAMDKYNSVKGLLAPAREGALRPLSGRYLLKLAAGQRSLMWSPLVFGIDTISILDTSSFPLFVVGSSVSCPPFRPESAVTSQIRRRETPAAARVARRGFLPSGGRRPVKRRSRRPQVLLHCPVVQVAFPGYSVGSSKVAFQLLSNLFFHPPDSRYFCVAT